MSTTTGPEQRLTKGERTRQRILDAAFDLFARSGYHAVSLRDIAAAADLTHAGVLKHFPGKDDLLLRVLERRDDEARQAQREQRERGDSFAEILAGTVRRGTEHPALVELFTKISAESTSPDHPSHAFFAERYRTVRETLTTSLRNELAHAAPVDPPVDPDRAAIELIALMDGLQVQWLLDPGSIDVLAVIRDAVRRMGIRVDP